jgi:hypothetical protein
MHRYTGFQQTLPDLLSRHPAASFRSWQAPTFAEFLRRIEHEFGDTVDFSSLHLTRADSDEPLTPGSVRSLCETLGVPPEDFGV